MVAEDFRDLKCKCGSTDFFSRPGGPYAGLFCAKCGKWIKWLTFSENRVFEHYQGE